MSFTDPQSVTINAVAKSMARIETEGMKSIYQNADESFKFTISHQKTGGNRYRSMTRLDQRVVAADPLTSVNDWQILGVYLVIDRPIVGFTSVQVEQHVAGILAWHTSPTIAKLYGLES